MLKKLHKQGQCSIRVLASFLGKISAAAQAVLPWRLCTRALLLNKNKILRMVKNWDTEVVLTDDALLEPKFWADKIQDFNGKDIQVEEPSWVTISDSSQQSFAGMELASEDPFIIIKDWDMDSQRMHNNYLETLASTETIKNSSCRKTSERECSCTRWTTLQQSVTFRNKEEESHTFPNQWRTSGTFAWKEKSS